MRVKCPKCSYITAINSDDGHDVGIWNLKEDGSCDAEVINICAECGKKEYYLLKAHLTLDNPIEEPIEEPEPIKKSNIIQGPWPSH